jgi:hypothetical protein
MSRVAVPAPQVTADGYLNIASSIIQGRATPVQKQFYPAGFLAERRLCGGPPARPPTSRLHRRALGLLR